MSSRPGVIRYSMTISLGSICSIKLRALRSNSLITNSLPVGATAGHTRHPGMRHDTAVGDDRGAGYVRGFIRGEEQHHIGDFDRLAAAAHRNCLLRALRHLGHRLAR